MGPVVGGDAGTGSLQHRVAPRLAATLDVGNPHLVLLVDELDAVQPLTDGPAYQAQFPGSVNVEWITVPERGVIDLVVFERGAGLTQACGSGATAAAAAASRWGLVDRTVTVRMPGGVAEVRMPGERRRRRGERDAAGAGPGGALDLRGSRRARCRGRPDPGTRIRSPAWLTREPAATRTASERREEREHRGGFGEFGGESTGGLIERTFREQIVLVGMQLPGRSADELAMDLDELAELVDTAGADAVGRVIQRRDRPDPSTFVGSGKAEEIHQLSERVDADTVVFDDELSPTQQFNLEKLLKRTALDRTAVILDIFAQNATTLEGKAQVELAQLRYRLPRLRRTAARSASRPAASAREGRARPSSRWTGAASSGGSPSSSAASPRWAAPTGPSARPAPGRARAPPPSSATRTPASRRCSTASPAPASSSRTGCSPRSTPPPAASPCPAARRSC